MDERVSGIFRNPMQIPCSKSKPVTLIFNSLVNVQSYFLSWILALLLGLMTIVLYWPATHHSFINYDDQTYVTENAHVQAGLTLENIKWAFPSPVAGNWHPLTVLSHMLDCQFFGLDPWDII
jgi:hypothetical protein